MDDLGVASDAHADELHDDSAFDAQDDEQRDADLHDAVADRLAQAFGEVFLRNALAP